MAIKIKTSFSEGTVSLYWGQYLIVSHFDDNDTYKYSTIFRDNKVNSLTPFAEMVAAFNSFELAMAYLIDLILGIKKGD